MALARRDREPMAVPLVELVEAVRPATDTHLEMLAEHGAVPDMRPETPWARRWARCGEGQNAIGMMNGGESDLVPAQSMAK